MRNITGERSTILEVVANTFFKPIYWGLIERDGDVMTRKVGSVTQKNLKTAMKECISPDAIVNTDEHAAYLQTGKAFKRHDPVNHSKKEYARHNEDGTVSHVNNCESFFSLLKRSIVGSWHHVSKQHLEKYSGECGFRWNTRKMNDGERMAKAVEVTEGKRLMYKPLIFKPMK